MTGTEEEALPLPFWLLIQFSAIQVQLSEDEESDKTEDYASDYVNDNPVIEVDDTGTPVCPPPVSILQHPLEWEGKGEREREREREKEKKRERNPLSSIITATILFCSL